MKQRKWLRTAAVVLMTVLLTGILCGCGASKSGKHSGSSLGSKDYTNFFDQEGTEETVQTGGNGVAIRSYDAHSRMICAVDEENRLWL